MYANGALFNRVVHDVGFFLHPILKMGSSQADGRRLNACRGQLFFLVKLEASEGPLFEFFSTVRVFLILFHHCQFSTCFNFQEDVFQG